MVKVRWYCGCYIAPHDYGREAQECSAEFETDEEAQEWTDGDCLTICPGCHSQLFQTDDHAELVEDAEALAPFKDTTDV